MAKKSASEVAIEKVAKRGGITAYNLNKAMGRDGITGIGPMKATLNRLCDRDILTLTDEEKGDFFVYRFKEGIDLEKAREKLGHKKPLKPKKKGKKGKSKTTAKSIPKDAQTEEPKKSQTAGYVSVIESLPHIGPLVGAGEKSEAVGVALAKFLYGVADLLMAASTEESDASQEGDL